MRATAAANQFRIYAPIGTKFGDGVSTHEGEGFRLHVAGRPHPYRIEGKSDRCRGFGVVVSAAMSGPRRRHHVADNYGQTTNSWTLKISPTCEL